MGKNRRNFRVLYAKKYTSSQKSTPAQKKVHQLKKKYTTAGYVVVTNISYGCNPIYVCANQDLSDLNSARSGM